MGIDNSAEILQQNMNDLFHGLEFIRAYIEDLFLLTKGDWKYHVKKLESMINKLNKK